METWSQVLDTVLIPSKYAKYDYYINVDSFVFIRFVPFVFLKIEWGPKHEKRLKGAVYFCSLLQSLHHIQISIQF